MFLPQKKGYIIELKEEEKKRKEKQTTYVTIKHLVRRDDIRVEIFPAGKVLAALRYDSPRPLLDAIAGVSQLLLQLGPKGVEAVAQSRF